MFDHKPWQSATTFKDLKHVEYLLGRIKETYDKHNIQFNIYLTVDNGIHTQMVYGIASVGNIHKNCIRTLDSYINGYGDALRFNKIV